MLLFGLVRNNERILIIINGSSEAQEEIEDKMEELFAGRALLRVHNASAKEQVSEYIYEVSDKLMRKAGSESVSIQRKLSRIKGISHVSVVRQDDEINQ